MDQRLFRIGGLRPHRLTKQDVPTLAKAMVAVIRGQASIYRHVIRDIHCLRFSGTSIDLLVRSEDWVKVLPFLKDGTLDPLVVPVSPYTVLDRRATYDASVVDANDPELYFRIITILDPIFTVSF